MDRSFRPTTTKEINELREQGLSMQEAVRIITKANYMKACQEATTVQELAEILYPYY